MVQQGGGRWSKSGGRGEEGAVVKGVVVLVGDGEEEAGASRRPRLWIVPCCWPER